MDRTSLRLANIQKGMTSIYKGLFKVTRYASNKAHG